MIVRSLEDIDGTEGDVKAPTFFTKRFLLRKDKMGFRCMTPPCLQARTPTFGINIT